MTHEDKELLLQDLSARLPYRVIIHVNGHDERVDEINPFEGIITCGFQSFSIDECKPYLRPMSSMTLEEHRDWMKYCKADYDCEFQPEPTFNFESCILSINWLNQHHFDYNNLIEEGLAIEVTKENNPYKE